MKMQNMIYALKNGNIVSIEDVESGEKCGCACCSCGGVLIARKGKKVMHHFAHKSTIECEFGYQTSIHMGAKNLIAKNSKIWIPDLYLTMPATGRKELIQSAMEIEVFNVILEKKINDIIPDILLDTNIGRIMVEIYVTHGIDDEKKKKIKSIGIPAIEIDLSNVDRNITTELLENILVNGLDLKKWIYNGLREQNFKRLIATTEKYPIISHNYAMHVMQCPLHMRKWKNQFYANFIDDCHVCDFFMHTYQNNTHEDSLEKYVWCSANQYVRHIQDLEVSLEKRKNKYLQEREEIIFDLVSQGKCPKCESMLVQREGPYGEFFACSQKYCDFTFQYPKEWMEE